MDDNISHPLITRIYRILISTAVLCVVALAVTDSGYKSPLHSLDTYLYAMLFFDFVLRIAGIVSGKYHRKDRFGKDGRITLRKYLFSFYGTADLASSLLLPIQILDIHTPDLKLSLSLAAFFKGSTSSAAYFVA